MNGIQHLWIKSKDCIVDGDSVEKKIDPIDIDSTILLKHEISAACIHIYKFNIINYGDTWGDQLLDCTFDISIGIIDFELCKSLWTMREKCEVTKELIGCLSPAYCYTTSIGKKSSDGDVSKYGIKCKSNDIITMMVDLNNYNIRYKVNDQDLGVAYDDIDVTDYRVGVTLQGKGSKIKIIN